MSIFQTFENSAEFGEGIFNLIGVFLDFIINFITNIGSYFNTLIDFFNTYVIELPFTLISMFEPLPYFVQMGLIVLIYAIYLSFAFRIAKLFIPFF